jgi:hypothetical protein
MATTWNPADIAAGIVLSNGDLTASTSTPPSSTWRMARGTTALGAGKVAFEINATAIDAANGMIYGLLGGGVSLTVGALGNTANQNGCGMQSQGNIYVHGSVIIATSSGYGGGSHVSMCCIDFPAAKAWWWYTAPTLGWNNAAIGSQNPATGLGGIDISSLTLPLFPAFCGYHGTTVDTAILNTAGSFVNSLPSGFVAWDTAVGGSSSSNSFFGL